jgi:ADP-ribosyl-[dinitrogen reductase] hydrolase
MRISPLPLIYHQDPLRLASSISASSEPTHPYHLNASCCSLYCSLIASCFASPSPSKGQLASSIPQILSNINAKDADLPSRFSLYKDLSAWKMKRSATISSSGYVLDTLEAALWAFFTTDTFKEGAVEVINLGDDADTVGAVYGGLAGAFYGVEAIPQEWINGLVKSEVVENIAQGLVEVEAAVTTTI